MILSGEIGATRTRLAAFETEGMDAAVAFNREMRFHRDRSLAHEDLALGRYRDHRRQQRISGIKVDDDLRTLLFHNRDEAVGGSEIDADDAVVGHVLQLYR